VHASWLNQVEIYFSVAQRKVVSPNDFHHSTRSRPDFQQYYEQIATPFEWKFTNTELNALLERIVGPPHKAPRNTSPKFRDRPLSGLSTSAETGRLRLFR
jgi:hypothetical protein